jgi:homoserine dehydrogenase
MTAATTWRLCLAGAGHVGAGIVSLLHRRHDQIAVRYGADLRLCGIAELGGCAVDQSGLDLAAVLQTISAGLPLGGMAGAGRPGMTARQLIDECGPDILLEATPVNLADGEPGLSVVRAALTSGVHVVLANKGPLALCYGELAALSDLADGWGSCYRPIETNGMGAPPLLRFSATVAGALPVVNMGRRDLAGDRITRIEAIFNGTTHSILRAMERGLTFQDALVDAQARGIAEKDPTLDVSGLDSACKLLITANAVLGMRATLADLAIEGITGITPADLAGHRARGQRLILLCLASESPSSYDLSVRPAPVPAEHPLARLLPDEMGVVYYTEHLDRLSGASLEPGPDPASAAMIRDVIDIVRNASPATRTSRERHGSQQ